MASLFRPPPLPAEDKALDSLLQSSKTPEGRSTLAANGTVPSLIARLSSLSLSPTTSLLILRVLRNVCAGERCNQDAFVRSGGPEGIASVVFLAPAAVETVRVGAQVLANVVAAGEEHRCAVWGRMFPEGFARLAEVEDSGLCDALSMILYNCCSGAADFSEGARRRVGELCHEGSGIPIIANMLRSSSSVGYQGDWLQFLLTRLCFVEAVFPKLFSSLSFSHCSDHAKGKVTDHSASQSQAYLLGILAGILSEHAYNGIISNTFALTVLQILKAVPSSVDFTTRATSSLPTGSPAVDILGYSLVILRDICALDRYASHSSSENPIDVLLSSGLCELLLGLLRDLEPPLIIKKSFAKMGNEAVGTPFSASFKVCPYKGFRSDIVAVIGNGMFGRRHIQDEIRQQNGILLLLQQCVTDDENPYLREWGIWAVRCLLDGNMENQRVVAELEVQGPVNTQEIAELGLKVEVDSSSKRPKLVNMS